MVLTSDALLDPKELSGRWGWFAALGVIMIVAGFIALMSVVMATVVSVLFVGVMMLASGIVEMIHGFQMKRWSRFFMWILIGAFYVIAGLLDHLEPASRLPSR